jgi:hypothetical protein
MGVLWCVRIEIKLFYWKKKNGEKCHIRENTKIQSNNLVMKKKQKPHPETLKVLSLIT